MIHFALLIVLMIALAVVLLIAADFTDSNWLMLPGTILMFAAGFWGLTLPDLCTTSELIKITEIKTYRLAPLLINENNTSVIVDDKYVITDGEYVLFSYFTENDISTNVVADADYVDFNDTDGEMSMTIKNGKLITRQECSWILFSEETEDCSIYELRVPEDAILHKTSDGKYTQIEEILD